MPYQRPFGWDWSAFGQRVRSGVPGVHNSHAGSAAPAAGCVWYQSQVLNTYKHTGPRPGNVRLRPTQPLTHFGGRGLDNRATAEPWLKDHPNVFGQPLSAEAGLKRADVLVTISDGGKSFFDITITWAR